MQIKHKVDWRSWLFPDVIKTPYTFPIYVGQYWMVYEPGTLNYVIVTNEEYETERKKKFTRFETIPASDGFDLFAVYDNSRNHVGTFESLEKTQTAIERIRNGK